MRVREKAYAKVNLALNVFDKVDGYHKLDSICTTIDLYDTLIVNARRDKKINLTVNGLGFEYKYTTDYTKNNAYKTAKAFMEKYDTNGVDIVLNKQIPLSSGLGGSSTDVSAVIRAMRKLYDIDDDFLPLANGLGSDSGYLLTGGYARLLGRGDIIQPINCDKKLNFVIVVAQGGVDTTNCFKTFDVLPEKQESSDIERLMDSLINGNVDYSQCKNALYNSAKTINGNVEIAFNDLKQLNPNCVFMSGSGSSVCAIFEHQELCLWAYNKLKYKYKDVFCVESINPNKKTGFFQF